MEKCNHYNGPNHTFHNMLQGEKFNTSQYLLQLYVKSYAKRKLYSPFDPHTFLNTRSGNYEVAVD